MKKLTLFLFCLFFSMIAFSQNFEPKWAGEVVVLNTENDTVAIPTDKANVQVKTSNSAGRLLVGIGNTRQKIVVKGPKSATQLTPDGPLTLIVKCKDNESDPTTFIQIVKFEEKKKERRTELANINWLGNVSEGNMEYIPFEADRYGKSSYILTMQPVEGEFGVRVLNPNDKDEKVTIFYCFGIHSPAPAE